MKKMSLLSKVIFLLTIIILSLLAQINSVQGTIFSGVEVASTGIIEYETPENAVETTLCIVNVSRSNDNSSISPLKILWEYTNFQNNQNVVWNKTRIILPRLTNESQLVLFNATVWINESIEFWFMIRLYLKVGVIISLNWTGSNFTPSVDNPIFILIIPVFCLLVVNVKLRRKKSKE